VIARLSGLVLLVLGLAGLWFALAGEYTVLMNPAFRWVTIVGAGLLMVMGALSLWTPVRTSPGALIIFGLFFLLVALARPHEGGVAPLFASGGAMPEVDRAGYAPVRLQTLFRTLDEEATEIMVQQAAVRGVVKRLPELDAQDTFVLLEPLVACCLADAVAFGVRVRVTDAALPEDGSWVYAFGDLSRLDVPVTTPAFRLGAILFNPVSRIHEISAHEVVSYRALLEDLHEKTPKDFAATFRRLVEESGIVETLRGEGPFTVFALHEAAFASMPAEARDALGEDRDKLHRFLMGLIVRGRHAKADLYDVTTLTTLAGTTLSVRVENGRLRIGGARVLLGAIEARNGVLYVVHPVPVAEDR